MNVLAALSLVICTSFFIGTACIINAERKSVLNLSACAVLTSLGWWSLCNAFFFAADTAEQAFFWHKLGAIGWCGFVACTAYYFLALTNYQNTLGIWWKRALFFVLPAILICKNVFGTTTSLAQNIILSTNGWGWTYENSVTSVWLWVFLCYVVLYFGVAFYFLGQWAKTVQHKMKRVMALEFIVLDIFTILFGVITDVILPLTNPVLPALASIGTAFFGLGYFGIIYRYDIFNVNLVISPDAILQTSNNSLFVMDENNEILKCNQAVERLLGYNKSELIGATFMNFVTYPNNFHFSSGDEVVDIEAKMRCKSGVVKDVLLSASAAKDKKHDFLCTIVSCQDVSKQKKIQNELEIAQQKYKQLADDYQKLAYYDPLTNLPNRRHLFEVLNAFEKNYHDEEKDFAVLFLDLDNFKQTNDLYGHTVGDELLQAAAKKLKVCEDAQEFVARLGGDEFMILTPHTDPDYIARKMEQIHTVFQEKIMLHGCAYEIEVSIGYGVFSQVGDTTILMQKADDAMYDHKKGKRKQQA